MSRLSAVVADTLGRVRTAAGFLTRLPVAPATTSSGGFLAGAGVAFPIVGLGIGLVGGIAYAIATAVALPPTASALAALAAIVVLTGALHEDGLADVCDGIGGGRDRDDRLRIMRDSHNGTFGTLALVFSVGIRATLLAALAGTVQVLAALVAAGAISRALLPAVMGLMAPARSNGLAADAGRPSRPEIAAALVLGFVIAWFVLGFAAAFVSMAVGAAVVAIVARIARHALGGHTGDVLGACQQVAEIAVLAVAVGMVTS